MKQFFILFSFLLISWNSQSQDFYSIYSVKDIKITFAEDDWAQILDSLKYLGKKERLIGAIDINGMRYDSVGIRYKGNSSYFNVKKSGSAKLPFNIKLDHIKKDQALPSGHETIKLSNIFRDPSHVREALSYEIARKYMPASQANFARLYVNGDLIGLYNSVESVDDVFLQKHFGENEGILIKCDPDDLGIAKKIPKGVEGCKIGDYANLEHIGTDGRCYERCYELKDGKDWTPLIQLTKILEKSPEKINQHLNVDQVLWMHAFNDVLVNLDSYSGRLCHNYYMYQDTVGVFHPIIWDLNLSFGGFRFADEKTPLSNTKMQEMSPFLHYKNENRPLISQLLANPLYRKIYIAHIQTILRENFSNEEYLKRIRTIQQSLDFYVKNDKNKLYEYEAFKANVDSTALAGKTKIIGVKELMQARTAYLTNHPIFQKTQATISTPSYTSISDSTLQFSVKVEGAETVYLAYRSGEHGNFQMTTMFDDGFHNDKEGLDGFYALELPKDKVKHYYIIAESEKTAQLSPERACWEFHQVR